MLAEHGLDLLDEHRLHDIGVSAFKGANVADGVLGTFLAAVRARAAMPDAPIVAEGHEDGQD